MLVSFISPVCNQGNEARETVACAREALGNVPHEIILVDDHSIDGSCHGMPKEVLIVRTRRREGVSSARRCGFAQSRGDVLIWSDPHCRYPAGSLERLANLAAEREAIYEPCIVPEPGAHVRHGGCLALSERGLRVQRKFRRAARFPALYGTIYAMRRDVYERLGGWPKLPGIWSYSEQALTLMAWFLKVPILVDSLHTCVHKAYQENRRFPFSVHRSDVANNAHFVHAAFFPETYPSYWKPMLDRQFRDQPFDDSLLRSRDFRRLRRHLRRHARRSEQQFFSDVLAETFPSSPRRDNVLIRSKPPAGLAYVRQQARRSKPKEYAEMRPRVDAALAWMSAALARGSLGGLRGLDAGTRDGYTLDVLASLGLASAEGVELVAETAEYARQQGRPVRQGDMCQLSNASGSIDLITCIHALEHVPQPDKALREFARVLSPGGWLYLVVPQDNNPERDACHNCAFPTLEAVKAIVNDTGCFHLDACHGDLGKLASGRRELRVLVQRNGQPHVPA
jgi:SAM-dependent methyltransferase/glycosyltransferase involved in cell wall biosynthesis